MQNWVWIHSLRSFTAKAPTYALEFFKEQHDLVCLLGLGCRPWTWLLTHRATLAMAACMAWPKQCAHADRPSPWMRAHRAALA